MRKILPEVINCYNNNEGWFLKGLVTGPTLLPNLEGQDFQRAPLAFTTFFLKHVNI